MLITSVQWQGVRIPLTKAPTIGREPVLYRNSLIIWIHTDNGLTGIGEAAPVGPGRDQVIPVIGEMLSDLAPSAIGVSPVVGVDLVSTLAPRGTYGDAIRLGLDIALMDLLGKQALRPISTLLDGTTDWVAMSAIIDFEAPEEASRQALGFADQGYPCIKLTLGARDPNQDIEVVRQVREAVGPDIALRADVDESWTSERAIEMLPALEPYNLDFLEQPVIAEDLSGLRKIRDSANIPIAADEAVSKLADAERIVGEEAADVLVVKPAQAGGIRHAKQIMHLARERGLRSIVSSSLETGVGIAAGLHLAASLGKAEASALASGTLLECDLLTTPLLPVRGHITVPQLPGLGVELDLKSVEHYATDVKGISR